MPLYAKKDTYTELGEPQWTAGGEVRITKTLFVDGRPVPLPDIVRTRDWAIAAMGADLYQQVSVKLVTKLMEEGAVEGTYVAAVGDVPGEEPPAPEPTPEPEAPVEPPADVQA